MESNNITSPSPTEESRPGVLTRIGRVFFKPSEAFINIKGSVDWILPFILTFLIFWGVSYQTYPIMYRDVIQPSMEQRFEQMGGAGAGQFADMVKNQHKQFYYPIIVFFQVSILLLIWTVIGIVTGNFIFAGKAKFMDIFTVVSFSSLIYAFGEIIKGIFVLMKDSAFVSFGLGLLMPKADGSFLYYFLQQISVFSVWEIFVICVGLGYLYKMPTSKFAFVLYPAWIVLTIIFALLSSL